MKKSQLINYLQNLSEEDFDIIIDDSHGWYELTEDEIRVGILTTELNSPGETIIIIGDGGNLT